MSEKTSQSSITQQLKGKSVILTDLDGLLVNSHNFNQVFIQKSDPKWIKYTVKRIVKSELHLKKLVQVLTKFIVTEKHPEWAHHALLWMIELLRSRSDLFNFRSSSVLETFKPLLSYATERVALRDLYRDASLRSKVAKNWTRLSRSITQYPSNLCYTKVIGIPSTDYVYVDDSDEEFLPKKRHLSGSHPNHPSASPSAVLTDEGDYDYEDEESLAMESSAASVPGSLELDDGVFDINRTPSSSPSSEASNELPSDDDADPDHIDESSVLLPHMIGIDDITQLSDPDVDADTDASEPLSDDETSVDSELHLLESKKEHADEELDDVSASDSCDPIEEHDLQPARKKKKKNEDSPSKQTRRISTRSTNSKHNTPSSSTERRKLPRKSLRK